MNIELDIHLKIKMNWNIKVLHAKFGLRTKIEEKRERLAEE